jgi:hypothetical protein
VGVSFHSRRSGGQKIGHRDTEKTHTEKAVEPPHLLISWSPVKSVIEPVFARED